MLRPRMATAGILTAFGVDMQYAHDNGWKSRDNCYSTRQVLVVRRHERAPNRRGGIDRTPERIKNARRRSTRSDGYQEGACNDDSTPLHSPVLPSALLFGQRRVFGLARQPFASGYL